VVESSNPVSQTTPLPTREELEAALKRAEEANRWLREVTHIDWRTLQEPMTI
jgi:hypothetical protein